MSKAEDMASKYADKSRRPASSPLQERINWRIDRDTYLDGYKEAEEEWCNIAREMYEAMEKYMNGATNEADALMQTAMERYKVRIEEDGRYR